MNEQARFRHFPFPTATRPGIRIAGFRRPCGCGPPGADPEGGLPIGGAVGEAFVCASILGADFRRLCVRRRVLSRGDRRFVFSALFRFPFRFCSFRPVFWFGACVRSRQGRSAFFFGGGSARLPSPSPGLRRWGRRASGRARAAKACGGFRRCGVQFKRGSRPAAAAAAAAFWARLSPCPWGRSPRAPAGRRPFDSALVFAPGQAAG